MNSHLYLFSGAVIFATVLASIAGLCIVRKMIGLSKLQTYHEVAGHLRSVVGTLYAVLLGLVIVDVQSKYQDAKVMGETEANAVANVFILSHGLPAKYSHPLKKDAENYTNASLKEWQGDGASFASESAFCIRAMWFDTIIFEPKTNREQACYGNLLTNLSQIGDCRRYRALSNSGTVSPVLWAVLIAGGTLTLIFTYFFGIESLAVQSVMTAFVALTLAMNILLVLLFSNPYKGYLRIYPAGLKYDKTLFELDPINSQFEAAFNAKRGGKLLEQKTNPPEGGNDKH